MLFWLLAGCVALTVDVPVARFLVEGGLPGDIRSVFGRCELFGHTYGLVMMLVTIYLLDRARRRHLPWMAARFIAAGMAANLLKVQVWRTRPFVWVRAGGDSPTFVGTIWQGGDWHWSQLLDHHHQSFPSGHTAAAVALAVHLGQLYPAGRGWFYVLAALCAMNRIDGGAHFVSDVCWGACLGLATTALLQRWEHCDKALRRGQPAHLARSLRRVLSGTGDGCEAKCQ